MIRAIADADTLETARASAQTSAEILAHCARLDAFIEASRELRLDLSRKTAQRRALLRGIPQALGPRQRATRG